MDLAAALELLEAREAEARRATQALAVAEASNKVGHRGGLARMGGACAVIRVY